jgi:hypothetical protein
LKQFGRLFVKGNENVPAEAPTFKGDNSIGKIAACVEHHKSGLNGLRLAFNVGCAHQTANGSGNLRR